jgi:hypothetical protein
MRSVLVFLGLNDKGEYQLFVSKFPIHAIGSRLEKGKPFPEAVQDLSENPRDPETAIAALCAMQGYLDGKQYGAAPLEFGVDELPLLRGKKK